MSLEDILDRAKSVSKWLRRRRRRDLRSIRMALLHMRLVHEAMALFESRMVRDAKP